VTELPETYCPAESLTFDLRLVKLETWRSKLFMLSRWPQVALEESVLGGKGRLKPEQKEQMKVFSKRSFFSSPVK